MSHRLGLSGRPILFWIPDAHPFEAYPWLIQFGIRLSHPPIEVGPIGMMVPKLVGVDLVLRRCHTDWGYLVGPYCSGFQTLTLLKPTLGNAVGEFCIVPSMNWLPKRSSIPSHFGWTGGPNRRDLIGGTAFNALSLRGYPINVFHVVASGSTGR